MNKKETTTIRVQANINTPIEKVWKFWTEPKHIMKWNNASDDWHTPYAENDVRVGKKFLFRMAAKDGSVSFDFEGTYTNIKEHKVIEYSIMDGRKVKVTFSTEEKETKVVETFEAENMNSIEMQKKGWQAILNNFKKYVEKNN